MLSSDEGDILPGTCSAGTVKRSALDIEQDQRNSLTAQCETSCALSSSKQGGQHVFCCGSVHTTPMYFRTYERCTNLDWTDWTHMRMTPAQQPPISKQSQLCCCTGLLHNWGVGLHSLGTHAGDAGTSQAALEQAAQRLADSAAFSRADPAPLNALGDVRMAQASGQV